MTNRTLGILGGALLVGGIILAVGSEIAASRIADRNGSEAAGIHRTVPGALPRHGGQDQRGPRVGDPRRGGFPAPGQRLPSKSSPPPTG